VTKAALPLLLSLCLAACGGASDDGSGGTDATSGGEVTSNQNAPPPQPMASTSAPPPSTGPAPATPLPAGAGTSRENPISACGPADSYRRVAEHRCPDGSQPLGGDPSRGSQARVGNVGPNQTGHIIDQYQVPCPSGPVDLFVDMYGCPQMQQMFGQ